MKFLNIAMQRSNGTLKGRVMNYPSSSLSNKMSEEYLLKKLPFIFRTIFILHFSLFTFHSINAQHLQSFIREAQTNHPRIKAYEMRYNIAQEKVNEVNSLPNTMVSAGYFVSATETRTGPQRARFSISQMLPWFGTITARGNYASSMAESEFVEIAIAKRKLALSVAQSYYAMYAIRATQTVLEENILLLKNYERLALTSVEVGSASAVDVLRLQIRQNELQEQKEVLQLEYLAEQAAFNNLLNRKESMAVKVLSELALPKQDPLLAKDSLSLNPELLKYDRLYESIELAEVLNQKERRPDIGFGLDYFPVSKRTDLNPIDNGKDILTPMVSLSIPIFNTRYTSVTRQNELRQQEIELQKRERLSMLSSAFAQAKYKRNQARLQYDTKGKNLRQTLDAEEILIKSYETGTIDFKYILDIQELQLKFQSDQIRSVRLYYEQSAIINYLIQ